MSGDLFGSCINGNPCPKSCLPPDYQDATYPQFGQTVPSFPTSSTNNIPTNSQKTVYGGLLNSRRIKQYASMHILAKGSLTTVDTTPGKTLDAAPTATPDVPQDAAVVAARTAAPDTAPSPDAAPDTASDLTPSVSTSISTSTSTSTSTVVSTSSVTLLAISTTITTTSASISTSVNTPNTSPDMATTSHMTPDIAPDAGLLQDAPSQYAERNLEKVQKQSRP